MVRVNATGALQGPASVAEVAVGKRALTDHDQIPVPVHFVAVKAVPLRPEKSRCVPSGCSAWKSYETAPGTGAH
jgi:hypothetical protein